MKARGPRPPHHAGHSRPRPRRRENTSAVVAPAHPRPTDWSDVADWYDKLVGDEGSEYHQRVIFPGVLRMLQPKAGESALDVACGQGALCRLLAGKGMKVTGVDSAEPLVGVARERGPADIHYRIADARELTTKRDFSSGTFDAAVCVLAIQNIHPIAPVLAGAASALRVGGRFVVVLMHPCFRGPKQTSWGWDESTGVQYRRVDRYLVPRKTPIVTHPGSDPGGYTWSFHKPIEAYVRALRGAGLVIDAIEEWPSHKTSQPGARSAAENQAREEIPMFMAIRAVKVGDSGGQPLVVQASRPHAAETAAPQR